MAQPTWNTMSQVKSGANILRKPETPSMMTPIPVPHFSPRRSIHQEAGKDMGRYTSMNTTASRSRVLVSPPVYMLAASVATGARDIHWTWVAIAGSMKSTSTTQRYGETGFPDLLVMVPPDMMIFETRGGPFGCGFIFTLNREKTPDGICVCPAGSTVDQHVVLKQEFERPIVAHGN